MKTIKVKWGDWTGELYTPKINNKKRGLLIGLLIVCLITPCTNWLFPLVLKGISKFNPLWMYQ